MMKKSVILILLFLLTSIFVSYVSWFMAEQRRMEGHEKMMAKMMAESNFSMLESQVGYHPEDAKYVILRSAFKNPTVNPTGRTFEVVDAESNETVYTGVVEYWGEKWGSYWWILDFSSVTKEGSYYIKIPNLPKIGDVESSTFKIGRKVLIDESLLTVALDQLDERLVTISNVTIWHGCAANITSEIQAVGTVVHALVDIYERVYEKLSKSDQQRVIRDIILGADYIASSQLASQNLTSDPLKEGTFLHCLLCLVGHDHHRGIPKEQWKIHTYNAWHDTAYSITVLARAYKVIKKFDEERATHYLEVAKKAWKCLTLRPYHLPEDLEESPYAPKEVLEFAKKLYNKRDPSWTIPHTLRTKEKLTFLWACTLMYDATGEKKYLDKAIEFADSIAERQFLDWKNPIEGAYGNFYEWEGDDEAFLHEWGQGMGWHLGYTEPTNLKGFIDLIRFCPDHPNAAKWYNVIMTYAENYVKKTAELTPFKIYPVACYKDPEHGGIKFFQVIMHGATGLYGQIAKNIMEIGDFLNDASYQECANQNVEFIVGLNPGVPIKTRQDEEIAWDAISLLKGIGVKSVTGWVNRPKIWYVAPTTPDGSGVNGFCAFKPFGPRYISDGPDRPGSLDLVNAGGGEDWIIHSHGYVSGICFLEDEFTLQVTTKHDGEPVQASITVHLKNDKTGAEGTYKFTTDESGSLTVTTLPLQRKGTISATWNGLTVSRPIQTLGGGSFVWNIDFATYIEISVTVPPVVEVNKTNTGKITITNRGTKDATVKLNLSSHGVTLDTSEVNIEVKAGGTEKCEFTFKAGDKVMPYLIYARAAVGNYPTYAIAQGKVG